MSIDFRISFFPKYHFLLGVNVHMCETYEISSEKKYDTVEVQLGLALAVLHFSVTVNKKGS